MKRSLALLSILVGAQITTIKAELSTGTKVALAAGAVGIATAALYAWNRPKQITNEQILAQGETTLAQFTSFREVISLLQGDINNSLTAISNETLTATKSISSQSISCLLSELQSQSTLLAERILSLKSNTDSSSVDISNAMKKQKAQMEAFRSELSLVAELKTLADGEKLLAQCTYYQQISSWLQRDISLSPEAISKETLLAIKDFCADKIYNIIPQLEAQSKLLDNRMLTLTGKTLFPEQIASSMKQQKELIEAQITELNALTWLSSLIKGEIILNECSVYEEVLALFHRDTNALKAISKETLLAANNLSSDTIRCRISSLESHSEVLSQDILKMNSKSTLFKLILNSKIRQQETIKGLIPHLLSILDLVLISQGEQILAHCSSYQQIITVVQTYPIDSAERTPERILATLCDHSSTLANISQTIGSWKSHLATLTQKINSYAGKSDPITTLISMAMEAQQKLIEAFSTDLIVIDQLLSFHKAYFNLSSFKIRLQATYKKELTALDTHRSKNIIEEAILEKGGNSTYPFIGYEENLTKAIQRFYSDINSISHLYPDLAKKCNKLLSKLHHIRTAVSNSPSYSNENLRNTLENHKKEQEKRDQETKDQITRLQKQLEEYTKEQKKRDQETNDQITRSHKQLEEYTKEQKKRDQENKDQVARLETQQYELQRKATAQASSLEELNRQLRYLTPAITYTPYR